MPYPDSTWEQQWREARDNAPFILVPVPSGHTPGPWYCHFAACIEEQGTGDYVDATGICTASEEEFMRDGGRGDLVAFVPHDGPYQANARLIAAAPEMLKTLRFVLPVLANAARRGTIDEEGVNLELEAAREVTDAIAKAEGRE
jgi:hypothetical protein